MSLIPEHLNEEQKEQYKSAWLNILSTFINAVKVILFLIILILVYIPIRKDLNNAFSSKPKSQIVSDNNFVSEEEDYDRIENGIHVKTGLVYAPGFDLVKANCTVCHSAKLVVQNRASREGWEQMINWMQKEQGLWDLGKNESVILDYLATHYAPIEKGRRQQLDITEIEWYILDLE